MDELIKLWYQLEKTDFKFNDYSHLHYQNSNFIRNFHKLDFKFYLKNINNYKLINYLIKNIFDENSLEDIIKHRNYIIKCFY